MAPIRDTTRAEALLAILAAQSPVEVFHRNAPVARVERIGVRWVLSELRLNDALVRRASLEAIDAGRGFRSENTWPFFEPAAAIYSAPSPERLARAVRLGPWPPRRSSLRWLLARAVALLG